MENFKSGTYINQGYYKSFQPELLMRTWSFADMGLLSLLSKADRHLGRLDMYSEYVNIDLYIKLHIAKEATQSSKIEGTQTRIEDVFLHQEDISSEKRNDWQEVHNYISAMNEAVQLLHTLPFSSRLIRQTHKVLLSGVRGEHKLPGEYRTSQNWIGGASINDATFIPPVHDTVPQLMSDLEKFANDELLHMPDLLKIAIIHYQFETIHPFLDGNGRVGRLLITLYLVDKGILKKPILYLSDYFERNRMLYYDNLMRVRTHHDLNQWLKFFLNGVAETAKKGVNTFDAILQLEKTIELKLKGTGTRSQDAMRIVKFMYNHPIINVQDAMNIIEKSVNTAYKTIALLEEHQILVEITGGQRGRLYVFKEYIDLFEN